MALALQKRLERLQADGHALEAEALGVMQAQQLQIQLLERQASQLTQASESEQRRASSLRAGSAQVRLTRIDEEYRGLVASLDAACQRTNLLESKLDAAKQTLMQLRAAEMGDRVGVLAQRRAQAVDEAKRRDRLQRTQRLADNAAVAAAALRDEIDTLRVEKLTFGEKMEALERRLRSLASERAGLLSEERAAAEAQHAAEQRSEALEISGAKQERKRFARRRQVIPELQSHSSPPTLTSTPPNASPSSLRHPRPLHPLPHQPCAQCLPPGRRPALCLGAT